jgi:hypothetical protein
VLLALPVGDLDPCGQHLPCLVVPSLTLEEHPGWVVNGRVLGVASKRVLEVGPCGCRLSLRQFHREPVTREGVVGIPAHGLFQ